MNVLAFGAPGPSEWMLILVIVLVLFGAKKLPELARGLGQSMNEFRKAREEFDRELQQAATDVKGQPVPPPQPYVPVEAPSVQPVPGPPSTASQDLPPSTAQASGSGR
jgi:sec-independent protein translocase protein TatA